MERGDGSGQAWGFMLAALVPSLGFMLSAAMAPALLSRPVATGSPLSLGLVLGLGLVGLLVALALLYTALANRRDRA